MDQVIIIPSLNPDARLVSYVDQLARAGFSRFIIIDDGSDIRCQHVFNRLEEHGCTVCHHDANRGKGAAIKTGIAQAQTIWPDAPAFITADGDGQHLASDVAQVARTSVHYPDSVILGVRDLKSSGVPVRSRFGNAFSSLFFRLDTGKRCQDTQTGLRCIPVSLVYVAERTQGERYDFEMNFLTRIAKDDLPLEMVPITTVYEDGNRGSHFNTLRDSYLIYRSFIRFALASLVCAAVDLGLFTLLVLALQASLLALVATATIIARVSSGILNFYLNRHWSFDADAHLSLQIGRYTTLFVTQMAASMLLVTALAFLPVPLTVVKIIVDSGLFVISYFVQRNWVFSENARRRRLPVAGDLRGVEVYGKNL